MTSNDRLPNIDVVIPMSGMWLMPYLRNCVAAIARQRYPKDKLGIIVSYMRGEKWEAYDELALFCADLQACVVFTRNTDPAFNIAKTKNVGARHGSREVVAFIDADTILHPNTCTRAAAALRSATAAIVPVARMPEDRHLNELRDPSEVTWEQDVAGRPYKRDGVGNIFVQRCAFEAIQGYDERFYGWGGPDTDLEIRLRGNGGKVAHLIDEGCPKAMHQWHKQTPTKESNFTIRNRKLMRKSKDFVRNSAGWGRIVATRGDQ